MVKVPILEIEILTVKVSHPHRQLSPTPTIRAPTHEQDIKCYYKHVLHYACLHDCRDQEIIDSKSVQVAQLDEEGGPSTPILLVTSPRWCPDCVKERTAFLDLNLQSRLVKIEGLGRNADGVILLKAYVTGVVLGRINALSRPLEEIEPEGCIDLESDTHELIAMMGTMRLQVENPECDTDAELGELAVLMQKQNTIKDELEEDLEKWFAAEEKRQQGFDEGLALQARLERTGVSEVDLEKRSEILRRALL
jgi:hypothetical protein